MNYYDADLNCNCSGDGRGLFPAEAEKSGMVFRAWDIMDNCLDAVFSLVHPSFPKTYRPALYVTDSLQINAFAVSGKGIFVHAGLIFAAAKLIGQKYTDEMLKKYDILSDYSVARVQSGLRVYFWRYVVLHELYHIWNGHIAWLRQYAVDADGSVVRRACKLTVLSECAVQDTDRQRQKGITLQALEMDADASAVCMLINLLMQDADLRQVPDKPSYITNEMGLIMGALTAAFCLFDHHAGARFEILKTDLDLYSHPIPSIRHNYAEEIADGMLNTYISDERALRDAERQWQKIVCDIEPDDGTAVRPGNVFYFTAHTEKAQKHLCKLKRRLCDLYDTLTPLALGNVAPKLTEDEMAFLPQAVWFTEDGKSLRGWCDPQK